MTPRHSHCFIAIQHRKREKKGNQTGAASLSTFLKTKINLQSATHQIKSQNSVFSKVQIVLNARQSSCEPYTFHITSLNGEEGNVIGFALGNNSLTHFMIWLNSLYLNVF